MDNYYPPNRNRVTGRIPNTLPDANQQVFTPKTGTNEFENTDIDWYDEPDYTQAVAQGIQEVLSETPRLTRSEAEEQMHLTELRRQAEGYNENDAIVISKVLAKKYPWTLFDALNEEFNSMRQVVDTITAVTNN